MARNESRIGRWLKSARLGGLEKLLEVKKAPGQAPKMAGEILEKLSGRLKEPVGLRSYGEIQNWLSSECQVKVAYKTGPKTVRYK